MHRAYSGEEGSPFRMVYTAQVMIEQQVHHFEAEHEKRHEQRRVLLPE